MEIFKDIEIKDLGLYLKKEKVLIISDLQIGLEDYLNQQGVLMPRFQFQEMMKRLEKIFDKLDIKKTVINGDLKHEFGTISDQEWRNILKLLDFLLEKGEVILVKGNHDLFLGPIAKKRNVKVVDKLKINGVLVMHGHKIDKKLDANVLIIGHEHPAITLRNEIRAEKYKCFLKGKWKNKILIVMPSFNPINQGTNVLNRENLSPFLGNNIDNFNVYVVEDKVYDFGKIKNLD